MSVDLDYYAGLWYEAARMPNKFEEGCENATAEYSVTENGLTIVNTCYTNGGSYSTEGTATVVGDDLLEVSFFPGVTSEYRILQTDYMNYALVDNNGKGLYWILIREPRFRPGEKAELVELTEEFGYDPSKLIWNIE